jgi:glycosyltransferase involved in cell wall biosynthesis
MSRQQRVSLVVEQADELALASELAQLGSEVTVFARRSSARAPARSTATPGVELHLLDAGPAQVVADDHVFAHMPALAHQLRRRWLARPPDVVHALSWTTGWAALSAGVGAPLVQTFAGLGGAWRRRPRGAGVQPFERRRIETQLLGAVAHVLVPGESDRAAVEAASAAISAERVSVVPEGVDPEVFRPRGPVAARGLGAATHRLLVHGQLVPRAGVDIVIRALVELPDTELVVAGGPGARRLDDDPEVRRLRALAQRCAVADRVVFAGHVPPPEVAALVRSADLAVCAPWHSRMGITPVEALACGCPVVASTVGGVPDAVVHGRTGLLVPPRAPEALVEAVRQLLDNPSLRRRMGEEGVARVRQQHTWAQVARSIRDIYRTVTTPTATSPEAVPA